MAKNTSDTAKTSFGPEHMPVPGSVLGGNGREKVRGEACSVFQSLSPGTYWRAKRDIKGESITKGTSKRGARVRGRHNP